MKLYCVKMEYKENGLDVFHILAENDQAVYQRLHKHRRDCDEANYPVNGFSFFEVSLVDSLNVSEFVDRCTKRYLNQKGDTT